MSVNSVPLNKEERARRNVDFYSFWLWHYMMSDKCTPADVVARICSIQTMKRSCNCRDKRSNCHSCSYLAEFLRAQKVFRIFKPWTDYANAECITCGLKHSADEILREACNIFKNNAELSLSRRFVLNRCGFCVKDVTVTSRKQEFGIQKNYSVRLTAEQCFPSSMVASDFERLDRYMIYLDENKLKHSQDRLLSFLIGIGNLGMNYVAIEQFLQELFKISMTSREFLNRAMGYWLYTKTKENGLDVPKKQCVDDLRDIIAEWSGDLTVMCKVEQRRAVFFKLLFDITKKCIISHDVFNLERK